MNNFRLTKAQLLSPNLVCLNAMTVTFKVWRASYKGSPFHSFLPSFLLFLSSFLLSAPPSRSLQIKYVQVESSCNTYNPAKTNSDKVFCDISTMFSQWQPFYQKKENQPVVTHRPLLSPILWNRKFYQKYVINLSPFYAT